jgi:orotate phosphoribosyltransferase
MNQELLDRTEVAQGIEEHLVRTEGDYELSAGGESTFYVDMKGITERPVLHTSANELAQDYFEQHDLDPDAIGGEGMGGTQTATTLGYHLGTPVTMLRGEQKDYGTEQSWEGAPPAERDYVVVDDVVTTGGSAIEMIERLDDLGGNPTDFFVFVDREEGGMQNIADETGVETHSLYDKTEIMEEAI